MIWAANVNCLAGGRGCLLKVAIPFYDVIDLTSNENPRFSLIAEQAKRRGAFLPLMCVNISL